MSKVSEESFLEEGDDDSQDDSDGDNENKVIEKDKKPANNQMVKKDPSQPLKKD